jgi:hypothetical protein
MVFTELEWKWKDFRFHPGHDPTYTIYGTFPYSYAIIACTAQNYGQYAQVCLTGTMLRQSTMKTLPGKKSSVFPLQ